MFVTLNLILEALNKYNCRNHVVAGEDIRFERICLLPETPEPSATGRLYVGSLSEALALRSQGAQFYCVCVRDTAEDLAEEPAEAELLSGLIIINENLSQRQIFSELQEIFYTVSEWVARMTRYAYEKRPMQDILELSEPVIGNFISVSDSALSLICYTKHIETEDPISRKLIENGYHPEESIRAFREKGLFEVWDNAEDLIINTSRTLSPYDICSKVFKLHNTYYIHAVMTCSSRPLTAGQIDLFRMLTDVLEIYVTRDWQQLTFTRHGYDRFLIELIEDRAGTDVIIENRARNVGLPMRGWYQLALIDFKTLDKLSVGGSGIELSRWFPEAKITVYQNRLLMLICSLSETEGMAVPEEKLLEWLKMYNANCAVSSVFTQLTEIRRAYEQTRQIFCYRHKLLQTPFSTQKDASKVLYFDNCYQLILLGENPENRTMWQMTHCRRMLKKIKDYDEKHGTNNLHLLYTYLFCGCSASETGTLLHMHRNNVLYRIGRIEDLLGISLSDQKVRYELFCGCAFLQLYGV